MCVCVCIVMVTAAAAMSKTFVGMDDDDDDDSMHAKLCHRIFKHTRIQSSDLPTVALTVQKTVIINCLVTWFMVVGKMFVCVFL